MFLLNPLQSLPWQIGSLIVVTIFVAVSIFGILLVRKKGNVKSLRAHHDVAGFIFANLGVLYSVLLGFTVVNVQQRFETIRGVAQKEAGFLEELYRDAGVFSEKDTFAIRSAIMEYGNSIVTKEWTSMTNGKPNPDTSQKLNNLWSSYYNASFTDKKQELWYNQSIVKLEDLVNIRLTRILGGQESLGAEMWTFLIVDGLALVGFMCFFGPESHTLHMAMASIFAASTAFLLFLIFSLDTIFAGSDSLAPKALIQILELFPPLH